jgi:hypothetical protein
MAIPGSMKSNQLLIDMYVIYDAKPVFTTFPVIFCSPSNYFPIGALTELLQLKGTPIHVLVVQLRNQTPYIVDENRVLFLYA